MPITWQDMASGHIPSIMGMATDLEWAWFAGLFEGEGCIAFVGVHSVRLVIHLTDADTIERCHTLTNMGRLESPRRLDHPVHKPVYIWVCSKRDEVIEILTRIRPFLGVRRGERADAALARVIQCRRDGHCKQGHAMTGANVYISPQGKRYCIICQRAREAARPDRSHRIGR